MGIFVCQNCGAQSPSWVGKCTECEQWNCLVEETPTPKNQHPSKSKDKRSKPATGHRSPATIPLKDIKTSSDQRVTTGIDELDRVLGGGVVKGSTVLVAGEPGIGKSTLMLQLASSLSKKGKVLYVSGEESPQQIKMRAERLGIAGGGLLIFPETGVSAIEEQINSLMPSSVFIDSIQTIENDEISSAPGSVSQIKECAQYLIQCTKPLDIPLFIIGQVTKEGTVAGPRILEHMVDTVLYFEGEQNKQFRIMRAAKNRFGSTNEVGIFEMTSKGLEEVTDPSRVLIEEGSLGVPGSVVSSAIEGSRPLLVEIQSLVSFSRMPSPRRVVTGLDYNKCSVIIGVLDRKAGIRLSESDVYLSVASGLHVDEPAMDLPVACAIVSCVKNKGIDPETVIIGEIGLTGEIRGVPNIEQRLREAFKVGFKKAVIPKANEKDAKNIKGLEVSAVADIRQAVAVLFP